MTGPGKNSTNTWLICLVTVVLVFPALFLNLDVAPFIDDEALRSLVAMEMIFSGDYITPTVAGELYLKKPPVYNWFITVFFRLSGNYSEFTLRTAAVVSLLVYLCIIFLLIRPRYGRRTAFMASLMFLTCGRILFFDSFHGLIDIAFSALVYLSLISIYYLYSRGRYWLLFLVSYALTGVTFLMKGLPSVYFQGASLLVWFLYRKNFRKLITLQHVAGILLFTAIVASYYLVYLNRNPGTLPDIIGTLFSESTQKTALGVSLMNTLMHLVTFPLEFLYHFLPWTVMVLYFLRRKSWKIIRADEFLTYNLLMLGANIVIFWLSAETYGRYLFIHACFLFPVMLLLHLRNQEENSIVYRIVTISFLFTGILMIAATVAFPFSDQTGFVPLPFLFSIITALLVLCFMLIVWRSNHLRLIAFAAALLVFRIGFNWFIFPSRERSAYLTQCRDRAKETGMNYKADRLFIYGDTEIPAHTLYYITREWEQPMQRSYANREGRYFIVYEGEFPIYNYTKIDELPTIQYGRRNLSIVRIND
jgi:4-amino-4-deoxy-L-arabinose transferase-like glycosyltransferase